MGSPSWTASSMVVRWGHRCVVSSVRWSACANVAMCSIPAKSTSISCSAMMRNALGIPAGVSGPFARWNLLSSSSELSYCMGFFPLSPLLVGVSSSSTGVVLGDCTMRRLVSRGRTLHARLCCWSCSLVSVRSAQVMYELWCNLYSR